MGGPPFFRARPTDALPDPIAGVPCAPPLRCKDFRECRITFSGRTFLPRIAAAAIAGTALVAAAAGRAHAQDDAAAVHVLTLYGQATYVQNPAYNRDRGPVALVAMRIHVEF